MNRLHPFAKRRRIFFNFVLTIALSLLLPSLSRAQSDSATPSSTSPFDNLKKNPELLAEFGRLLESLRIKVQLPSPHSESRLLPLLPDSTLAFASFSNYGPAAAQTLKIFRQELQQSKVLRDWWQHGDLAGNGPKIEDFLEKFAQLHQYLGDEIVVSGAMASQNPGLLVAAEVRKPGLKKFLDDLLTPSAGKANPSVRVLDAKELAAAADDGHAQQLIVFVRPDFVAAGFDLPALRKFSARLERANAEFVSAPFGKRILQAYSGGVTLMAAADLQKILALAPPAMNQNPSLQHSGFADLQYLVWEHQTVAGQPISSTELSFTAPRHSVAAWLAKPAHLGGLDFVSPNAIFAASFILANPVQTLEDIKTLATSPNSNPFAALDLFEKSLNLSVKDDLLSLLAGEITLELDNASPQEQDWKAILRVSDAAHLQRTLTTLLAATHTAVQQSDAAGAILYTLKIPSGNSPKEIGYAFIDGYFVLGAPPALVSDAIALHKSGASLAKSPSFLASLPPGHSSSASALFFQNPVALATLGLRQAAPDMAGSLAKVWGVATPAVLCLYGAEKSIRQESTSPAFDAGVVLVAAAIAIPNLLRSKIAANEAGAVGSIRSINTAQITYDSTYEGRGYAPNLAALGLDPQDSQVSSPEHAGLLDPSLANQNCAGDGWCIKSGYQFLVVGTCKQKYCKEFVAIATPVDTSTGTRSFCSTSDLVIHYQSGLPLHAPITVSECRSWPTIQ